MDYYAVLEISPDSSVDEIRKAYHKMALRYHPDKCQEEGSEEKFRNVVESYEVLSDSFKRRRYDLSRKLEDDYQFQLAPEILKFTKFFFSEENMKKFTHLKDSLTYEIKNFGINFNFDFMLHSFLNNIRNGRYQNLIDEYHNFNKFYEADTVNLNTSFENLKKKYQEKINRKKNEKPLGSETKPVQPETRIKKMDFINPTVFQGRCININVNVNLENIFQRDFKVAEIPVDVKCPKCMGLGVVKEEPNINRKNKNSRNKKKKNNSRKKQDTSYSDKKICSRCNGLTKIKETKSYIIDTSMDRMCYLEDYYMSLEEGYYDIIFNIKVKPHPLFYVDKKHRYDIFYKKEITIKEYYYGGCFNLPYLNGEDIEIKWDGWNNGKLENTLIYTNLGLYMIPDNNYVVKNQDSICQKEINLSNQRGNLYVKLILKIPILDTEKLENPLVSSIFSKISE